VGKTWQTPYLLWLEPWAEPWLIVTSWTEGQIDTQIVALLLLCCAVVLLQCPKGTYTTELNIQPACTPCNDGVTTEAEGSASALACNRAIVGHYFISANLSAAKCPVHTYKNQESAADSCTPCPFGWMTRQLGADGVGSCLAPPGTELRNGSTEISPCAVGWYKADWNR
jgi:hypothetical protein